MTTFQVQLAGQAVPLQFQTVSFSGIREIVAADVAVDIAARAAKAANLSDLASAATARTNLGGTATGVAVFTAADATAARTAIGSPASADALLTGEVFTSTVATQPTGNAVWELTGSAVGRAYDSILINHSMDTASNGVHVLCTALTGCTAGQAGGFATDGPGTANASTSNRQGAGAGSGAEGNRLGSGDGYGVRGICSSTGAAVAAIQAYKQNDDGTSTGTPGTGPALDVTNVSSQGRAIDSTTAANNTTDTSNIFTRQNTTNGIIADFRSTGTTARTGEYSGARVVFAPTAAWSGASAVYAFNASLSANVTGSAEVSGVQIVNDAAGNTVSHGVYAYSRGANTTNVGLRAVVSGGGTNIAIRGEGGDIQVFSGVYSVDGVKVVGAQGAAVADATDAASAITQLNALLARCRAHGLIAT